MTRTIKCAAFSNLPQQTASSGVATLEQRREQKRRKITPWLSMDGRQGSPSKAQDPNLSKMKVLDVKVIQQLYKRISGAEILQSTKVFDGTGKKPQDENSEAVLQLLLAV